MQNQLEIIAPTLAQKSILSRLLEFYLYDASNYSEQDVNEEGVYGYRYLDSYWEEADRFPYLFRMQGKWAGFALVNPYVILPENLGGQSLAEFFVMRKYRRLGVGRSAFHYLARKHPGAWEIRVANANVRGRHFWPVVINELTGGDFEQAKPEPSVWDGPIYHFSLDTAKLSA